MGERDERERESERGENEGCERRVEKKISRGERETDTDRHTVIEKKGHEIH